MADDVDLVRLGRLDRGDRLVPLFLLEPVVGREIDVSLLRVGAGRPNLHVGLSGLVTAKEINFHDHSVRSSVRRGRGLCFALSRNQNATAIEQDFGRFLPTGYHGPLWTAEDIALLGTAPDEAIARRTGRTPEAVARPFTRAALAAPTNCG